ncbi:Co2+/Mg2+ efflux protein ApaG [Chthonobacter rhizosphaerae]|uniref:Co2+/Mg2+ efflux protein ApaG n=1 Tax=Chthonobacter rhizosphaerae TaxID=2735553 RepID=UPI0015EF0A21|nr:Co2+/Mg2+ efflux protein ApaG [Chthonobacter rhizosphaerae]
MFRAVTRGIVVSVEPTYLAHESNPDEMRWVWSYRVEIENRSKITVQLLSRRWLITDANGIRREVAGQGVVGEQPIIRPGGEYAYTSGCPLGTPSGIMEGTYRMVTDAGELFDVDIPAFSLDKPDVARVLN